MLYICTVICNVVLLRNHGGWRSRTEVCSEPGKRGWLDLRKADPLYWGKSLQARLLDPKARDKDLLPVLQYARVLTIKEGGIAIQGTVITSRGAKSKAIKTCQTWWCVIHQEEAYAALARMDARSSSGFHVNDDDCPE
jgi:hypothetical protein